MDNIDTTTKRQLLGDDIDEWRCPECGSLSYTHKSQGALLIRCNQDHGGGELNGTPYKTLVWMVRVTPESD